MHHLTAFVVAAAKTDTFFSLVQQFVSALTGVSKPTADQFAECRHRLTACRIFVGL